MKRRDFRLLGLLLSAQFVNLLERQVPERHTQEVIVRRAGDFGGDELPVFVNFSQGSLVRLRESIVTQGIELLDEFLLLLAIDDQTPVDDGENETHLVGQALELRLGETNEHVSALRVHVETKRNERFQDLERRGVLGDDTVLVEQVHVGDVQLGAELELLLEARGLRRRQVFRRHGDDEVHGAVRVVFLVVGDERLGVLRLRREHVFEEFLVIGGPRSQRQFSDFQGALVANVIRTSDGVASFTLDELFGDGTVEVSVPRMHHHWGFTLEHESDIGDEVSRIEVRNARRPSRTDAFGAVHQHERENGVVVIRFDALSIFVQVVQQRVITFGEHRSADFVQTGEDVTRAGVILATLQTCTELAARHEQVDIVGTDEILSQVDDGHRERSFTVMVRGVLGDVAAELRDFNVRLELTLEAREENLALRRLEAVDHARDGTHQVSSGEQNELFVDEFVVSNGIASHVQEGTRFIGGEPRFTIVDALLAEGHVNQISVAIALPDETLAVMIERREILLRLIRRGGTETLVVLDVPTRRAVLSFLPRFILGHGVEHLGLLALRRFDDGRDELEQKSWDLEQRGEVSVQEVDQQTLDVRTIVILIRHDHQLAVTQ